MNLPDFTVADDLNQLRRQMGAELITWNPRTRWEPIEVRGIDILPKDIKLRRDGTLEYNGRTVIVYIRDQHIRDQYELTNSDPNQLRKFHVADCSTLQQMRREGRYERYVVTTRTDGNSLLTSLGILETTTGAGVECQLYVCMHA